MPSAISFLETHKRKQHSVADNTIRGDSIPEEELEDEEFDQDAFVYDPSKNSFDKGCLMICFNC